MEKTFHLEIVTPRRTVYDADVESFSAPGTLGGFQVLVNHAPLLSSIRVGAVKVVEPGGNELHYATSGGFVEVRDNRVTLLAETAERSDEIDAARAEAARTRSAERLATKTSEVDTDRARAALQRAINRLKVAGRG
jgi:F-type H+-transporting ATPase subunit epsilon